MDSKIEQILVLFADIFPGKYIQALIIVLSFFIIAKAVNFFVTSVIGKLVKKTKLTLDDEILEIFHRPVFISIILLGLAMATIKLQFTHSLNLLTMGGIKTIVIVLWTVSIYKFMQLLLNFVSRDDSKYVMIQDRTLPLFNNLMRIISAGLAIYFIFLAWDIDVSAWMASAGILGLAISFAAKDTLANLFAGVFIVADAPYKLGDFIVLDSGERGEVTSIGIRSTRLLTRDDVEITVPNSIMGNAKITNEAGGPHEKYRIRVKVGVAYGSDIDHVHQILFDIGMNHPDVCEDPEPRVRFRGFGDSSLDHELLCWVEKPVLRGKTLHMLYTEIYKQFTREGIEIPFPQRDIHIKSGLEKTIEP